MAPNRRPQQPRSSPRPAPEDPARTRRRLLEALARYVAFERSRRSQRHATVPTGRTSNQNSLAETGGDSDVPSSLDPERERRRNVGSALLPQSLGQRSAAPSEHSGAPGQRSAGHYQISLRPTPTRSPAPSGASLLSAQRRLIRIREEARIFGALSKSFAPTSNSHFIGSSGCVVSAIRFGRGDEMNGVEVPQECAWGLAEKVGVERDQSPPQVPNARSLLGGALSQGSAGGTASSSATRALIPARRLVP